MGTRADTFYPSSTDQDFSAPSEVDIRKLVESVGGSDNTTVCAFSDGAGDRLCDPYTTRSSNDMTPAPDMGWAINRDGTDGMTVPSTPTGTVRFIEAGNWTINARLGVAVASTATIHVALVVYRVDSSGNRSLLFGTGWSNGVTPSATGVDVSQTSSQPEYTFADDETLLCSIWMRKSNSLVGSASNVQLRLNDTLGQNCSIVLPSGIRTRFPVSDAFDGVGTLTDNPRAVKKTATFDAAATAAFDRSFTGSRTATFDATATLEAKKSITKDLVTLDAVCDLDEDTARVELAIGDLPTGGGGSSTTKKYYPQYG